MTAKRKKKFILGVLSSSASPQSISNFIMAWVMQHFLSILITGILCTGLALLVAHYAWNRNSETNEIHPGYDLIHAAAKGRAGTVWIQDQDANMVIDTTMSGAGSGVIISPDGYIVTNYHVVKNNESIHVTLSDKREFKASLIGADTSIDVALIKIDASDLPYLEFASSDSIIIGEGVIAVGNPHRLQFTVTSGIVSALDRPAKLPNNSSPYFIQSDVPINNGNSGGALLNAKGELIGLNIGIVSVTGAYEGFSLAVPGNIVKKISDQLRETGASRKGSLDIRIRNVNKDDAVAAGMTTYDGVVIDALTAGGTADRAGLQSLDIITTFNSKPVLEKKDFMEKLTLSKPGDVVKFGVNRGGKILEIEVRLK